MIRAFVLLASLTAASVASATDFASGAPEATLSWRLAFGGSTVQTGYGLALGYRAADPESLSGQLLQIDVSDRAAFARLAGLPLFERSYQANQDGETTALPADTATDAGSQWYTRKWVWWTVGGLAATAALAGGGGDVIVTRNSNNGQTNGNNSGCAGVSGEVADQEMPCASETVGTQCVEGEVCVFCGSNGVTDGCSEWTDRRIVPALATDPAYQSWLDAGTGWMGDLIAR